MEMWTHNPISWYIFIIFVIYFFAESRLLSKQIAQFAGKAQFVVTYTAERKKKMKSDQKSYYH